MNEMKISTSQGNVAVWDNQLSGKAIIFVHGNSACKEVFEKQMNSKIGRSYRVIAIDLPGHGKSDHSSTPNETYTYVGYARVLVEVISKMNLPNEVVLAGWSLGGHVIIEMINPQNLFNIPQIKGILITGTPPISLESKETRSKGFLPHPQILSLITKQEFSEQEAKEFVELGGIDAKEHFIAATKNADGIARQRVQAWKAEEAASKIDQTKTVAESIIPFLVVAGASDIGINTKYIANEVKFGNLWQNKVHIIENTGHAPFWNQSEIFNKLFRRFLKEVFA